MTSAMMLGSDVIWLALVVCCAAGSALAAGGNNAGRSPRSAYGLSADVINSTSVNLKWHSAPSPDVDDDASCTTQLFLIRLKQDSARRVRTWKVDGARRSVSLHGLLANTLYHVRIVAVDCEKRSRPSRWVTVKTSPQTSQRVVDDQRETTVPGQPVDVATRSFSDSVYVSWKSPEDASTVRGYVIGYGEGVPDVNWQYLDADRRNVTIRNLKRETQYVVSVRAFNNIGKGPVIYDLVYTTDSSVIPVESAPLAAPTNVQSKVLSSTTIWLQWTDPSIGRQQTVPDSRYYNVHYQAVQPLGKALSAVARDLHVILYNLQPATRYEFKVRTVKDTLTSQYSTIVANRTYETAPSSAPRDVRVTHNTDDVTSVRVKWRQPRHANGNITEYLVFYTWNEALPSERWQMKSVGPATETTLRSLNMTTTYYFRVQARNSHGFGPKSDIVKLDSMMPAAASGNQTTVTDTTSAAVPSTVVPKTTGSDDTTEVRSPATSDNVDKETPDANTDVEEAIEEEEDSHYDYIEADDALKPTVGNVTREASASSSAKSKREPNSASGRSTGPASTGPAAGSAAASTSNAADSSAQEQVSFQALVTHHVSVYLTWPQAPPTARPCAKKSSRHNVVGYQLRYGRIGDGEYISRSLTQNVVLLDGLMPNTRYRYQLKYVMRPETNSVWSQEAEFDTTAADTV